MTATLDAPSPVPVPATKSSPARTTFVTAALVLAALIVIVAAHAVFGGSPTPVKTNVILAYI